MVRLVRSTSVGPWTLYVDDLALVGLSAARKVELDGVIG